MHLLELNLGIDNPKKPCRISAASKHIQPNKVNFFCHIFKAHLQSVG